MIKVELDQKTALELTGDRIIYTFEQCKTCAKLYDPLIGHKCEMYAPKAREDVVKGIIACMINGCGNQCPYFKNDNLLRLFNGHRAEYACREHLKNDIKRLFSQEV